MAKVVFCQRIVYSLFGIMTISAVLKKHGHASELVMDFSTDNIVSEILVSRPDIVAFSTLIANGDLEWAVEIADKLKCKYPDIITVFGNIYPTLFPDETMENTSVDVLCRGEGEFAMLELCNSIDNGSSYDNIPNLHVRTSAGIVRNPMRQLIDNLDDLPFPDRDLYQKYNYFSNVNSIDVFAGRACPFNCSYCYNHVLRKTYCGKGTLVRKYSVDYMIAELEEIKNKYNPRSYTFVDELFTIDMEWLREFAEKYRNRIALPFICNVRADTVDEETASLLADAGAFRVCLGLETGNEELRIGLLNKPITDAQYIEASEILHRHKIKFLTTNMIGLPGETVDNAFETIKLNQRIKTDFLYFSVFQPYPKLEITKNAESMGFISHIKLFEFSTTYFKGSSLDQENIGKLVNLHKLFYIAVKFPYLKPLLRQLIKLPANLVFDIIFIVSFGWLQISCFRRNPIQLLTMGLGNLQVFYSRKKRIERFTHA